MPTFECPDRFWKDHSVLDDDDKKRFREAIDKLVEDLSTGDRRPRPGLRVKGVQGADGVFEMTWAPDGRATFEFGPELREGEPHIVWRRVGTHDIFGSP